MARIAARTMLHKRLQGGMEAAEEIVRKMDGVTAQIGGVQANVGKGLDGLRTDLGHGFATVTQRLGRVSSELELIHTAILAASGRQFTEPNQRAFECIRVLNQVEDLVTDHDFAHVRNNALLTERWDERPTQECYQILISGDPNLGKRFQAVYGPFQSDEFHERAARYVEIDQLRRDIVGHFGPSPTPPGTAPDTDTRRGRRK